MGYPPLPPETTSSRSLALLVTSPESGDQLIDIATSARAKSIALRIHLIGAAATLSATALFDQICTLACVSVCQKSARKYGIEVALRNRRPPVLLPCRLLADFLMACDRQLVL